MGLIVYRFSNYEHTAENEQYRHMCQLLKDYYGKKKDEHCLFLANYNIGQCELDALLIKQDAIIAVEFKNYGGRVTAVENGEWLLDGKIEIKGGSHKNVYSQARRNRSAIYNELVKDRHILNQAEVFSLVVFHQRISIDNRLSSKTQTWLHICDESSFMDKVEDLTSTYDDFSPSYMLTLIDKLELDKRYVDGRYSNTELLGTDKPEAHKTVVSPHISDKIMRVTVDRWDDDFVYATVAGSGDYVKVSYSGGFVDYDYDWTYLREMFREGARLNIIHPHNKEGVIYPELIIYEPDYLVNITSVARCFTDYAVSPLVDLIKKLEPAVNTEPIVLGNFAGQLLDETLRQMPDGHTYNDSVKDFFKGNALKMLTLQLGKSFHNQAKKQQHNIEKAFNTDLPEYEKGFSKSDGLVEPSFICEMLGLRGRMDYLQRDMSFLIEQKSGKGDFPIDYTQAPKQKEEHYVQMLLYMLIIRYNYEDAYKANGEPLRAYLLYSKYDQPLLHLPFSTKKVFEAIKVRNGIAWRGIKYAQPGGFNILTELTPDTLNERHAIGRFWDVYLRPPLEKLLAPIHAATDLERAYYLRFLEFVANEENLSLMGGGSHPCSGFASAWHATLEEKLEAGNIYNNLRLVSPSGDSNGEEVTDVVLRFSETEDNVMSNFRKGDSVALYPYLPGTTPDIRATMIFNSTIKEITSDTITLTLTAPQHDARAFIGKGGNLWAIEHSIMSSSSSSLYKGLHAFLSAPKERRDLLLLQREPRVDTSLRLKGDYDDFNDMALKVKQARDIFLIIGPPGTGKTSYGLLYTLREELLDEGSSALLVSFTNRTVDEICSKLEENGIDYIRIGPPESCSPAYKDRLLSVIAGKSSRLDQLQQTVTQCRVVVGTAAALNSNIQLFQLWGFSLCIVDEASQILEPYLVGLLSAYHNDKPAIGKLVMIGDYKQLPAVVQQSRQTSRVDDPLLNGILLNDCRDSLFERLCRRYGKNSSVTFMLTRQGRMHTDIALFPSKAFYDGKLEPVSPERQALPLSQSPTGSSPIDKLLGEKRVIFLSVKPIGGDEPMKINRAEADVIASVALKLYDMSADVAFNPETSMGIIVPYRNQITAVRNAIERACSSFKELSADDRDNLRGITIDTVERFQGSERDTIIYGFTAHHPDQLNFLTESTFRDESGKWIDRKLLVAITRAKQRLILVGNAPLLSRAVVFKNLIDFVSQYDGFLSL